MKFIGQLLQTKRNPHMGGIFKVTGKLEHKEYININKTFSGTAEF